MRGPWPYGSIQKGCSILGERHERNHHTVTGEADKWAIKVPVLNLNLKLPMLPLPPLLSLFRCSSSSSKFGLLQTQSPEKPRLDS